MCSDFLNTATNHKPYWGGGHNTFTGGGARTPVRPAGYGPGIEERLQRKDATLYYYRNYFMLSIAYYSLKFFTLNLYTVRAKPTFKCHGKQNLNDTRTSIR